MAKADAWGAPGGMAFARRETRSDGLAGNTRLIAEPAYKRLLAAEPLLRRSIPALIIIFLLVIAALRVLSLMNERDDVERDAKAILTLAAGQLASSLATTSDTVPGAIQDLLETTSRQGSMSRSHVLVITDSAFKITAVTPRSVPWQGHALDGLVEGGQPLLHVQVIAPASWRSISAARTGTPRSAWPRTGREPRRPWCRRKRSSTHGARPSRSTSPCSC